MTRERDFWSRRREAVRAEAEADEAACLASTQAEDHAELEKSTDEEILAKLNLPDPDAMKPGDDFSGFMARAVPERLRRRALRKLWLSNPLLANVDGLVDYGEDFTDSALAVENLQTAYQVGKGMLKHVMEMERQSKADEDKAADIADAPDADNDPKPLAADIAVAPDAGNNPEPLAAAAVDGKGALQDRNAAAKDCETDTAVSELEDENVATPRRMHFTFETDAA